MRGTGEFSWNRVKGIDKANEQRAAVCNQFNADVHHFVTRFYWMGLCEYGNMTEIEKSSFVVCQRLFARFDI